MAATRVHVILVLIRLVLSNKTRTRSPPAPLLPTLVFEVISPPGTVIFFPAILLAAWPAVGVILLAAAARKRGPNPS
jgi:hypothetical protein